MREIQRKCASCDKKFKKTDGVVATDAGGSKALVHDECLYDYVLGMSMQDYYSDYEEYLAENK